MFKQVVLSGWLLAEPFAVVAVAEYVTLEFEPQPITVLVDVAVILTVGVFVFVTTVNVLGVVVDDMQPVSVFVTTKV